MAYIDDFEMREDLDEMTLEELQEYREKVEEELDILEAKMPDDEETPEYEEWDEKIQALEEHLDDIDSYIDDLE